MTALYKQQLGVLIKRRREDLGLTQKDLAERANISESQTVSRWERGVRAPTDLDAVASALETTVAEMLSQIEPIGQKQRRRMDHSGTTQLDRIEQQLAVVSSQISTLVERLDAVEAAAALFAGAAGAESGDRASDAPGNPAPARDPRSGSRGRRSPQRAV